MQGPEKHAPVMLPAYLDLWAQTKPAPALVPEVSLFLHGPESGPADIQVVWRTDLEGERSDEELTEIVSAIRPSSLEAVSVPFAAAKRWLGSKGPTDGSLMADIEGGDDDSRETADAEVFRWNGDDSERVSIRDLRPGDTVVVPSSKGGLWNGCFDPTDSRTEVSDLAERAALMARGRATLRLHPSVLRRLGLPESLGDDLATARERLQDIEPSEPWMKLWLERLRPRARSFVVVPGDDGWACIDGGLVGREALRSLQVDAEADVTSEEEESSFTGRAVPLKEHSNDVQNLARQFAAALRLPKELADDLALAGWLHDIGKADRRFQLMLRGGDEIALYKDETIWAKSGLVSGARYEQGLAQRKSGYPKGARHEVQSVAMLEAHLPELQRRAHDLDLVLHLVASHHGHCRPFAPPVKDTKPVDVTLEHGDWKFQPVSSNNQLHRLDSAVADRFWKLNEKYGWLELCWFEAILRLADHRASEAEQEGVVA